jgi:homospermidine synthase
MVSWMVKQALIDIASDLKLDFIEPQSREQWARLMRRADVKGIHIAERDTQRANTPKRRGAFINTWSVEGFIAEGLQPSELGWGTHEKSLPPGAHRHDFGCDSAIYLTRPGAGTRVRSWTPTARAQHAWMITHNESISIADYFTLFEDGALVYRPTCHYAYHPCDDAVLSLHEMAGAAWRPQQAWHILSEDDIVDGIDERDSMSRYTRHGSAAAWMCRLIPRAPTGGALPCGSAAWLCLIPPSARACCCSSREARAPASPRSSAATTGRRSTSTSSGVNGMW